MPNKNTDLERKKTGTHQFFFYGNVLPLIVPMFLLLVYNEYNNLFRINNLMLFLTILMPSLVYFAYTLYDKKVLDNNSKWTELKVDILLYFVATITMILIALQINLTGGFDNSIMIFYFYFIPSAIAISFKAKWGLIITLLISFFSISINYWYKPNTTEQLNDFNGNYKWLYIGVIAIHLISLGLLEFKNNKNEKI